MGRNTAGSGSAMMILAFHLLIIIIDFCRVDFRRHRRFLEFMIGSRCADGHVIGLVDVVHPRRSPHTMVLLHASLPVI